MTHLSQRYHCLCSQSQRFVVSLALDHRRKPTVSRADPPVIPVTDEISPNENLQFLCGHSLRIVAVIEKLAFHSGPHAFASGIIVAPATSTVHALNNTVFSKNFNRPRYTMLKDEILESGDVLIVTELDRLGRNKEATLKELRFFKDNGIRVMVLELPTTLIDLSAMENSMARMMLETINNMMIELYASMAQAEIEKKEKRQREGIEQKKARGEWDDYGRPRVMDLEEFATHYRLVQQGEKKPFELMRELGMTKPTFYRYKNQIEKGC